MADRWATYEEAGHQFGLSADAMRKRARRLGWRVQAGNDGKARVLVPEGTNLSPDGRSGRAPSRPDDREDDRADGLLAELRRRAEVAESRVEAMTAEVAQQRERAARAEGELSGLQAALQQALERAQRTDAEATAERAARQAAETARDTAAAAAEAVRGELAEWTAGGPIGRAWRALIYRQGRPR